MVSGDTIELINLPFGSYTITVDSNGCIESSTISVNQPFAPIFKRYSYCCFLFGFCDGEIDLSVSGGTSPYSYLWSNGETTQDIDSLIAGSYSVVVTDTNNCIEVFRFL